jgi:inward rectifier potassium channel
MSAKKIRKVLSTDILEVFQNSGFDFYHEILKISHKRFLGTFVTIFLSLNVFFGSIYYFIPGTIIGTHPPSFVDCFSFSVQTMGTVGYGTFYPDSLLAHALVTLEVMIGLLGIGTFAALAFARISLPSSKLIVSNKILINEDDGEKKLMFRVAHLRQNFLVDVDISLQMLSTKKTGTGQIEMVMEPLELEHDFFHVLTGAWIIKHHLNEQSPIFDHSSNELRAKHASLIATITGTDGTTSEAVNYVYSYSPDDIIWNQRFKSIIQEDVVSKDYLLDLTRINETESSKILATTRNSNQATLSLDRVNRQ